MKISISMLPAFRLYAIHIITILVEIFGIFVATAIAAQISCVTAAGTLLLFPPFLFLLLFSSLVLPLSSLFVLFFCVCELKNGFALVYACRYFHFARPIIILTTLEFACFFVSMYCVSSHFSSVNSNRAW